MLTFVTDTWSGSDIEQVVLLEINIEDEVKVVVEKADRIEQQGKQVLLKVDRTAADIRNEISRTGDNLGGRMEAFVEKAKTDLADHIHDMFYDRAKEKDVRDEHQDEFIRSQHALIEAQQSLSSLFRGQLPGVQESCIASRSQSS